MLDQELRKALRPVAQFAIRLARAVRSFFNSESDQLEDPMKGVKRENLDLAVRKL